MRKVKKGKRFGNTNKSTKYNHAYKKEVPSRISFCVSIMQYICIWQVRDLIYIMCKNAYFLQKKRYDTIPVFL